MIHIAFMKIAGSPWSYDLDLEQKKASKELLSVF